MAGFPHSVDALKRAVVGLESELAPILSLEMAAGDAKASRSRHATRKPVKVQNSILNLCFCRCLFSISSFAVSVSVF